MPYLDRLWDDWVAEGLTHEECWARATEVQRAAIALYDTEHARLSAADPLFAEYYARAYESDIAGPLRDWALLPTLPRERRRQLRADANYLYGLFLRTGGY